MNRNEADEGNVCGVGIAVLVDAFRAGHGENFVVRNHVLCGDAWEVAQHVLCDLGFIGFVVNFEASRTVADEEDVVIHAKATGVFHADGVEEGGRLKVADVNDFQLVYCIDAVSAVAEGDVGTVALDDYGVTGYEVVVHGDKSWHGWVVEFVDQHAGGAADEEKVPCWEEGFAHALDGLGIGTCRGTADAVGDEFPILEDVKVVVDDGEGGHRTCDAGTAHVGGVVGEGTCEGVFHDATLVVIVVAFYGHLLHFPACDHALGIVDAAERIFRVVATDVDVVVETEGALDAVQELWLGWVGDVEAEEVGVAVDVEDVVADAHVGVGMDGKEANGLWACWVGIVEEMEAFHEFVYEEQVTIQIDPAGLLEFTGGFHAKGLAPEFVPRLVLGDVGIVDANGLV